MRRLLILLHESDPYPRREAGLIWCLLPFWKEAGIEIKVVKGTSRTIDSDLVFPHIDITRLPSAYQEYLSRYPRVVNRTVIDISKRVISPNLLSRGDSYPGPVIVKTDRNCGGVPERLLERHPTGTWPLRQLSSLKNRISARWSNRSLASAVSLDS